MLKSTLKPLPPRVTIPEGDPRLGDGMLNFINQYGIIFANYGPGKK